MLFGDGWETNFFFSTPTSFFLFLQWIEKNIFGQLRSICFQNVRVSSPATDRKISVSITTWLFSFVIYLTFYERGILFPPAVINLYKRPFAILRDKRRFRDPVFVVCSGYRVSVFYRFVMPMMDFGIVRWIHSTIHQSPLFTSLY